MKKVLVMIGLPASGKTTFAKNYYNQYNKIGYYSSKGYRINHIDFDKFFESYRYNKYEKSVAIEKIINDHISLNHDNEVILDGLFLTNEDIIRILNKVRDRYDMTHIEIHYWKPNIENCLWNDKYRRQEHSEITIKNAKINVTNIEEEIKTKYANVDVKIIEHEVIRKPEWKVFADKYNIELNDTLKMKSASWCLGGSYQNCWGTGGSVSSEDQPTSYEDFDLLLEKICPNITFLQYKKLYNSCIEIETYNEHDYYGGSTEHAYFECDIEKLYNGLKQIGLTDQELL